MNEKLRVLLDIPEERKSSHTVPLWDGWKKSKKGTRAIVKDPTSPTGFSVGVIEDNKVDLYHLEKGEIPFALQGGFGNIK